MMGCGTAKLEAVARVCLATGTFLALVFVAAPQDAAAQDAATSADRAAWLAEARFGVMTHYLADWQARAHDLDMSVDQWNHMVDNFDAAGLAEQLQSVGAGYLIFTIGQNSGYYAAPNAAYDAIVRRTPSRCSRRDLIADLARELRTRNLKLIVYLPAGAPGGDRQARTALQWQEGARRNREFQQHWETVIREWSLRWGDGVAGWWFDGCYWPNAMYREPEPPNFASFAAAARAGHPQSIVAFNPGVVDRTLSVTQYEDYIAGEINFIETTQLRRVEDGRVDGARIHKLSYLGRTWGTGPQRYENLDDIVIPWTRRIIDAGGAVTWDAPIETTGLISEPFIAQLRAIDEGVRRDD
jgi:hypothetical protein